MPNIPDSRAPSSAGFSLPEENINSVANGLGALSDTLSDEDVQKKLEGLGGELKSGLDDTSKYLQEKLRDVDVYEELSEFTSGIYQAVRDQLGFAGKSPDKISQEVSTAYAEKKSEILARQEFDNPETATMFNRKLDEKIGYDQEALGAFQKQALAEKIHATVDRHIEKYNSGVEADPSTLTDAIVVIDSSINDLAPGIGRDAAVEKSAQARKSLLSFALQGHAKQGNYGALQTLLDGIDPATGARINIDRYVDGVDKAYFQDLTTKGLRQEGAVRFLDDMAAAGLSAEEQFQEMSLHPDSDLANEALSLFKSQERARARAQREAIRESRYAAWGNILETGENAEVTDIPLDADENLRREIETHIERGPARDDFTRRKGTQALYEIKSLRVSDPEAFQRLDLSHYFKDLSRKQIGQVMAMQQAEPDPYETAHFKLRDRLALRTWKEITGRNGRDELETANFADFRTRLDERIEEYEQLNKKQAGPFEVEEIVNTMRDGGEVVDLENEGFVTQPNTPFGVPVPPAFSGDDYGIGSGSLIPVTGVKNYSSNLDDEISESNDSVIEEKNREDEFKRLVEKELDLPEGSTVSFVADEQTSMDEEETGKPSYKVVVTDKDGNIVEGPVSKKRLPGEPNEQSYLRYDPDVGFVEDSFKSTRIVSGSPGQGFVDASGRVTRSVTNIPGVGLVNTENYVSVLPTDERHAQSMVANLEMWMTAPDLLKKGNPSLGTNKYYEDDITRIEEMRSRPPSAEEKINYSIIKDVISSGYDVNSEGNYAQTFLAVYEAVEQQVNKRKQHSTRFNGPRPLEHYEVATVLGKLIAKGTISPPDLSQQDFPGLVDIVNAGAAGGLNTIGSSISGLGDIIEAIDELSPGAIEASLFPALWPSVLLRRSGQISETQFQEIVPEVFSTFLEENRLGWMLDPSKAISNGFHTVGDGVVDISEKLKPDQQHWITDFAYDTGEVLTKIGISAINPVMAGVMAAGDGAHKQKIRAENSQANAKEKSLAVLGGAVIGVTIEKVDKLVKILPEPAKKWFANRVIGSVFAISKKTGIPVDKILKNQGTQLLKDAVEGGVNALIARLAYDPDADIWDGITGNITPKTLISSLLSPALQEK
ncbi:hypothetical protein [Kiloniella antarctica]|uniref:Large polyvalent protein associated domain-containing protein n=1 Tax=Kiloniella antarctica TaxID=1550907 RepID=A0ABW5BHC2_9PROT